MTSRDDAYDELATRLLALADELPTPYEEDRFYSIREQNRLRSNIALVQEAAAALRAAPPTTKPSGEAVEGNWIGKRYDNEVAAAIWVGMDDDTLDCARTYPIARPVREHLGMLLDAENRLIARAPSEYGTQIAHALNTLTSTTKDPK